MGKKPISVSQSAEIIEFLSNAPEEVRNIKRKERLAAQRQHSLSMGEHLKDDEIVGFSSNPLMNSSNLSVHHYRLSRKEGSSKSAKLSESQVNSTLAGDDVGAREGPESNQEGFPTNVSTKGLLPQLSPISPAQGGVGDGNNTPSAELPPLPHGIPRLCPLSPLASPRVLTTVAASLPISKP